MCYKTILALCLVAVTVNAEVTSDPYGVRVDSKGSCLPCGPLPSPHVYFDNSFSFDLVQGTWKLMLSNDIPPECNKKCVHWSIYPINDTVGNINRCWNNPNADSYQLDCGRKNGGGFVTYSRPEISDSFFNWESDRWSGYKEYIVLVHEDNLLVVVQCVKGIQYIYILVKYVEEWTLKDLNARVIDVIEDNNMNPHNINPHPILQDSNICSYDNDDLSD